MVDEAHLSVNKNVAAEDERGHNAITQLKSRGMREEGGHEAEEDENPEGAEEVGHPYCTLVEVQRL